LKKKKRGVTGFGSAEPFGVTGAGENHMKETAKVRTMNPTSWSEISMTAC
jgi:hypothetical protein